MKQVIFGALIAAAGALSAVPSAVAQPYGAPYVQGGPGYGHGYGPSRAEAEDWERRREWRMHRREFWRQQREIEAQRAYEAGRREAHSGGGRGGWGYR